MLTVIAASSETRSFAISGRMTISLCPSIYHEHMFDGWMVDAGRDRCIDESPTER
jgi:hypothetical protein